jgi:hypothetical protein
MEPILEIREPKRHHSLQATRLIHEHFGTVMSFVYSRGELEKLVEQRFHGEWKYLHKALFEIPQDRAERALIELALYLRVLDDDEEHEISKYVGDRHTFGELIRSDGSREPLLIRDVANKIIHAARYDWIFPTADDDPRVVCVASEPEAARHKWTVADINVANLGTFCGMLMS